MDRVGRMDRASRSSPRASQMAYITRRFNTQTGAEPETGRLNISHSMMQPECGWPAHDRV